MEIWKSKGKSNILSAPRPGHHKAALAVALPDPDEPYSSISLLDILKVYTGHPCPLSTQALNVFTGQFHLQARANIAIFKQLYTTFRLQTCSTYSSNSLVWLRILEMSIIVFHIKDTSYVLWVYRSSCLKYSTREAQQSSMWFFFSVDSSVLETPYASVSLRQSLLVR